MCSSPLEPNGLTSSFLGPRLVHFRDQIVDTSCPTCLKLKSPCGSSGPERIGIEPCGREVPNCIWLERVRARGQETLDPPDPSDQDGSHMDPTGPKMDPTGLKMGPMMDPTWIQHGSHGAQDGPNDGPNMDRTGPNMDPTGPKIGPKMGPSWAQIFLVRKYVSYISIRSHLGSSPINAGY
jgi:hypothetical protein